MLLAQIDYDTKKAQDGIAILEKLSGSSAASRVESTIRGLEGDGYMQLGKPVEAAKRYEIAAQVSTYENERAYQRAKAGRAYQIAGDTAKARIDGTGWPGDGGACAGDLAGRKRRIEPAGLVAIGERKRRRECSG